MWTAVLVPYLGPRDCVCLRGVNRAWWDVLYWHVHALRRLSLPGMDPAARRLTVALVLGSEAVRRVPGLSGACRGLALRDMPDVTSLVWGPRDMRRHGCLRQLLRHELLRRLPDREALSAVVAAAVAAVGQDAVGAAVWTCVTATPSWKWNVTALVTVCQVLREHGVRFIAYPSHAGQLALRCARARDGLCCRLAPDNVADVVDVLAGVIFPPFGAHDVAAHVMAEVVTDAGVTTWPRFAQVLMPLAHGPTNAEVVPPRVVTGGRLMAARADLCRWIMARCTDGRDCHASCLRWDFVHVARSRHVAMRALAVDIVQHMVGHWPQVSTLRLFKATFSDAFVHLAAPKTYPPELARWMVKYARRAGFRSARVRKVLRGLLARADVAAALQQHS
jgi:hypothetical protein